MEYSSSVSPKITASAPGKLMLFGEHAVVYGRPCLVTAVDLRVSVTVELNTTGLLQISTPLLREQGEVRTVAFDALGSPYPPETAFVEAAIARVVRACGMPGGLSITTDGPRLSYGLGSSSAVTVATVAAFVAVLGVELGKRAMFELAYAAVLDAQGKGSGFDVASAVYGGTLYYVGGGTTIIPLEIEPPPLLIGYSGAKVSTRRFVDGVAQLHAQHTALIERIFDSMGAIADEARGLLGQGAWERLGELMDINQGLLDALGVNTPSLARLIYAAREAGALGAKLSGAGGGDCMYALAPEPARAAVEGAIREAGERVSFALGAEGVRIE